MRTTIVLSVCIWLSLGMMSGCRSEKTPDETSKNPEDFSFMTIGDFTVHRISSNWTEVRDGAGRTFVLIPRGQKAPEGYAPHQVVRVPVRRVVAYSPFSVAILKALGVLEDVLVGVTAPRENWHIEEVATGMADGRIVFLGDSNAIDYERLKMQAPELVLTWNYSVIPMMTEMEIPCVITSTPVATCLHARMRFVNFLAPFFNREKEAEAYFTKVSDSLETIRETTRHAQTHPKVMWGDVYTKRVLVEPGNAWVAELVGLVQSNYLFDDVYGRSCIEISLERFLSSGRDADILFTYRTSSSGVTSKAALARLNPLLAGVRPLKEGRVYAPLPHYIQSGDRLDEILTEIAAILHPDCYPGYQLRYFLELPDQDPEHR